MKELEEMQEMYLEFRKTIDTLAFPAIFESGKEHGAASVIYENGKPVGFMLVEFGCIEAMYIKPEYRRKGIAEAAVRDYIKRGGVIGHLVIVHATEPAKRFWNKIFELQAVKNDNVETAYAVIRIKPREGGTA